MAYTNDLMREFLCFPEFLKRRARLATLTSELPGNDQGSWVQRSGRGGGVGVSLFGALDDPPSPAEFGVRLDTSLERPMHAITVADRDVFECFVDQLDRCADLNDMKMALSASVTQLGFKSFTYHIVREAGLPGNRLPFLISTYPQSWVQHYFSHSYLDEDPVVGEMLRRSVPFQWSKITIPACLSRRQRLLLDEARDAGLEDGLTIPIQGHGGGVAALSVVPNGSGRGANLALRRHRHLLHLVAVKFHQRARTLLLERSLIGESSRRSSLLSPRERESLEWIARGKSTWEIAVILEVSEKGVEFHVENAKRKLQATNRTQAVVKAIMLGIIDIY